ncbi:permease-like cell division protein FtsX [Methylobacter sp. S3L5C]|uniref:permease-like cell division protein FtsX n=1 Tax=Methylobacter sp. S3L5C TaxID=2839024 RepID=UPI001FABFFF8|nr:permease-like cell division protein FtsX [Methylobacter sp. S3L5C]UOA08513.1 permease-like cell division protein FtsX [Methylobacter sp. S3L5C]
MKRDHKNRIRKDIPVRSVRTDVRQTKTAGGNFVDKIKAYRDLHAHALFSSLGRLVASPFTSIMTIAVLAIAISLASGFYILVVNLQQLTGNLETSNQLSLFLRDDVSDAHANKLADSIRQNENVQDVKIISRKQALTEFQTYSGFGTAINALEENPLPIVIQVLPKNSLEDKQGLEDLLKSFEQSPEVDFAQMDLQWIERLQSIMSVARLFATLLNLMLGGAVLFIIGNTIRLELHTRRDEVVIAKLVGATNGFIRRPFLYTGFWIGFISGVSAWFVVTTLMLVLRQSVEKLSGLYGDSFHLLFLDFTQTLALIGISSALGVLGSWAVLMYQLQHTKSE